MQVSGPFVPQANPNELTNGVINSAFMLLFKDSIRLFAAYNEGVINLLGNTPSLSEPVGPRDPFPPFFFFFLNLLTGSSCGLSTEKYFDMKKNQCKDALDIYKKFLYRMTKLSEFLKVAEVKIVSSREQVEMMHRTLGFIFPTVLAPPPRKQPKDGGRS